MDTILMSLRFVKLSKCSSVVTCQPLTKKLTFSLELIEAGSGCCIIS